MRAADLTLQEDGDDYRTIDEQLASGWISGWERPLNELASNAMISVRDDDRPPVRFGALVPRMASSSHHEIRYGKTEIELRGLVRGLVAAGHVPHAVAAGDAPDALVRFDVGDVWIEHAEVIDAPSARYTNMMHDLSRDIKDAIDDDKMAADAMRGHHVELRLSACPTKAEVRVLRNELFAFLRRSEHTKLPPKTLVHLSSSTFRSAQITMYRAEWNHIAAGSPHIVNVQSGAHSFSPLALAPVAYRRLDRKRKLGRRYGVAPLWLVLTVTDIRGVWDWSMDSLASSCPAIEPYSKVIVWDGPRVIIWADGRVVSRDLRGLAKPA